MMIGVVGAGAVGPLTLPAPPLTCVSCSNLSCFFFVLK